MDGPWQDATAIDPADPILDPLRAAYPGFDAWLARVREDRRPVRIVRDAVGVRALLIAKPEPGALKVCSLVVRPDARGQGLGSSLVREALELAKGLGLARVWATAYPDPAILAAFAAAGLGAESQLPDGQLVLARPLDRLGAVRLFHLAFGQTVGEGFAWRDAALRHFLRDEEVREAAEALRSGDAVAIAGELADVLYVTYGDAVACGFALSTPPAPADLGPVRPPEEPEALIAALEEAARAVRAAWEEELPEQAAVLRYQAFVAATDAAAAACGLDLAPVLAEIERANLLKEAVPGGKARKPAGWLPPRLSRVVTAEMTRPD